MQRPETAKAGEATNQITDFQQTYSAKRGYGVNVATQTDEIKRRAFLVGSAMTIAFIAAQVESAENQDPHPAMLEEWRQLTRQFNALTGDIMDENVIWQKKERLAKLLCKTPATTVEGLQAQFDWFREDLWVEVRGTFGDGYKNAADDIALSISQVVEGV